MLVIGLIHLLLIWNGDILTLYAVCGLLLIPMLRLPTVWLAVLGAVVIVVSSFAVIPIAVPNAEAFQAQAIAATRVYAEGSFAERRFHFGPAEWLWRSLSYGRRQPMLRDDLLLSHTDMRVVSVCVLLVVVPLVHGGMAWALGAWGPHWGWTAAGTPGIVNGMGLALVAGAMALLVWRRLSFLDRQRTAQRDAGLDGCVVDDIDRALVVGRSR